MSHIHLLDGVLPVWLWLTGYAATFLLVGMLWRWGRATVEPRRFSLLGILSAMMILVMMIEIPPFEYHFNLSVVVGILLGPELAVLAAVMVNLFLALIGHGGVTVIGLNSLILSTEMVVGFCVYRLLTRAHVGLSARGFWSAIVGLAVGTAVGYGFIAVARPWIDPMLRAAGSVHELGPGIEGPHLNLVRLAVIMFGIGSVGWVLEGILTGAILRYLQGVYPGLVLEPDRSTGQPVPTR